LKVGLLRPITLYPYPEKELADLADQGKTFLVTELNVGQMVEDVRMAAGRRAEVHFYGRPPGAGSLPSPEDILHEIRRTYPA
jgi:2-oxoglutarate ferredoxin oxidoreductase subunit alpha